MGLGRRLYRGEIDVDFVGKWRLWYSLSAALLAVSLAGLLINGLNLGVEFKGGSVFSFQPKTTVSVQEVRETFLEQGIHQPIVQTAGERYRVTTETLAERQSLQMQDVISKEFGTPLDQVNVQSIGASWGGEVSTKALWGLVAFMVAIILYLSMAFEPKMALAAIVALLHDLIITAGVYAWSGFEVTPATLLGFLTILGYSLYDAVVVFDMIKEVTAKLGTTSKQTYSMAANDALNHTLIRSLNTSLVAILPVAAILFIGTTVLGAGTLKDLALALFVGMIVGTYSSICVATPMLVTLKEREPKYQAIARRLASTGGGKGSGKGGAKRAAAAKG
ncbi:protein translocase subunit SecF [Nonomuraea sp. NPDC048826]|uniref:protein translocase subunit SecF n=1 Tax=Nonomuraea sp. NPDC048826 TaxID=3364347 RepID=UPI00371E1FE2